jgi:methylated-DNA-[protein]-cysteine S-methyltransferase
VAPEHPALFGLATWLERYAQGDTRTAALPPLAWAGSAFEAAVWQVLCTIPWGHTLSYGEVARRVDASAGASLARAVGTACGANPLPLLVPCHRVIGADGSLVGFSGGLEMKTRLLQHEGALLL